MNQDNGFELQRASMVDYQLRARGIGSPLVLEAMGRVPRERFIPGVGAFGSVAGTYYPADRERIPDRGPRRSPVRSPDR